MCAFALVHSEDDLDEFDRRAGLGIVCHGDNLLEFLLDRLIVAAANVFENLAGVFCPANGSEVTGRVGQHLDAGKEEDGRHALEGEQEAPADGRVSSIDKAQAKVEPVGDRDAEVVGDKDVAEECTAVVCRRDFRNEYRSDASEG